MIAHEVGYRGDRLESVRLAGLLHDVGKLGVPTGVLRKAGRLTDAEYAEVSQHPVHGMRMLGDVEFLADALVAVHHHHERLDGSGYPLGLAGDQIPEAARIVSVADTFDSMTSTRSYRRSLSVREAVAELRRCAGTQLDPVFVEALIEAVERDGWVPAEPAPDAEPASAEPAPDAEPASASDSADPAPEPAVVPAAVEGRAAIPAQRMWSETSPPSGQVSW
jgi:hypothetical protein